MPAPARFSRRPQAAAWAAVALLHALLLGLLLAQRQDGRQRGGVPREQAPLLLRLPPLALPARAPAPQTARRNPPVLAAPAPAHAEPQPARPAPAPVAEPRAITLPPPTAPAAASSAPAPLDLALPRGPQAAWRQGRNPALDDPRANTERASLETAIARVMGGDDRVIEERLDNDRIRVRRGAQCVEMHRSRAGQIDPGGPFGNTWQARPC